jgi:hypothetical protein
MDLEHNYYATFTAITQSKVELFYQVKIQKINGNCIATGKNDDLDSSVSPRLISCICCKLSDDLLKADTNFYSCWDKSAYFFCPC